jgi:hypothetical protein
MVVYLVVMLTFLHLECRWQAGHGHQIGVTWTLRWIAGLHMMTHTTVTWIAWSHPGVTCQMTIQEVADRLDQHHPTVTDPVLTVGHLTLVHRNHQVVKC